MLSGYRRSQRHDDCGVVVVQHSPASGRQRDKIATKVPQEQRWIAVSWFTVRRQPDLVMKAASKAVSTAQWVYDLSGI